MRRGFIRIGIPMLITLFGGVALGFTLSTLMWSGQVDRGFRAQADWKRLVDEATAGWQSCIITAGAAVKTVR